MYTNPEFESKDDLIAAVRGGRRVSVFQPRKVLHYIHGRVPVNGSVLICSPYTDMKIPHTWFAEIELKNGIIVEVLGGKKKL